MFSFPNATVLNTACITANDFLCSLLYQATLLLQEVTTATAGPSLKRYHLSMLPCRSISK